uniref:Protein kinase domain-containing protein n=1 Tax=Rhizophagus irregularis (strain DAOM 181602 / DAOM 197198 / MUCL 43194) TaxID=747089 RepID=U9TB69_RHIID
MDYPNKIIYFNKHCENCDKISTNNQDNNKQHKWCKSCQINYLRENFINWTSGNKKIDNFIQDIQLKINHSWDTVFEWIPYSQFNEINQHDISGTKYSIIWKDGPLYYNWNEKRYIRDSNKRVAFKYLISNSQDEIKINECIYKLKEYIINKFFKIYGISQNPDTKDYIMVLQIECREKVCIKCENFVNWTSENEKIDNFIQEMQLKIENYNDIVFEWIPYIQFSNVERIGVNDSAASYSATWKDGPLNYISTNKYERDLNKEIILKCYYNTQDIDKFLNEVYSNYDLKIYGISKSMDTKNYILVVKGDRSICVNCVRSVLSGWCKICSLNNLNNSKWTSGNNEIDRYIQEMQSKIDSVSDIIFEWIPYNQFIDIKKIVNESNILYSAKWKDGPIIYNKYKRKYKRNPNQEIVFKYYYNTQYIDELLSEARKNANIKGYGNRKLKTYGISQNPDTKNYIIIFQDGYCKKCYKVVNSLEWIPYNQFIDVKELRKYEFSAAKWKNGQLNVEIILKYFCNIQNEDKFLYEAELYLANNSGSNEPKIYGISQNPDTKYYIMVFQNMHCKYCENFENFTNWTSGNKKVDDFIQEMQLKINDCGDIILEWIPYNQFIDVKELGKQDFSTVYLAKWKDGPLKYNRYTARYERNLNEVFTLKCFYNSQNMIDEFLYKAELYSIKVNCGLKILKIYGISQNPDTDDYIIVQNKSYECCEICDNILTDIQSKWCKACQINNLRENFTNQISGNEEVDNFIQEMQLKVNNYDDIVVELISYNQFEGIEEVRRDDFSTICLAKWKDGPLYYDVDKKEYKRISNETVILKFLDNSQYEFLNKILKTINKFDKYKINVLQIYGISQNPDTKDYIVVFQNERCTICGKKYRITYKWCKFCHIEKFITLSGNKKIDDLIQEMQIKTHNPGTMVFEWIPYSEFDSIKKIDKGGFSVIYSAIWKIGPLSYDFDGMKYIREPCIKVALKYLNNSQNLTNEFLNEAC